MKKSNLPITTDKMTASQSMSLIVSTIIGVGVLTLPRTASQHAFQQGWISIVIGFAASLITTWVITLLCVRIAGEKFSDFVTTLFAPVRHPWIGQVLGIPILLLYIGYWLLATALVARTFGEVVVTAVLLNTPIEVVVISMLLLSLYLCVTKDTVVFRVNEVFFPLMVVPLLLLAISSFQKANFTRLMPLYPIEFKGILLSLPGSILAFQGNEIILQFSSRFSSKVRYMTANLIGIGFIGLVYISIGIAGIVAFGYEELQRLTWPTLELVKTVNVPGLILERTEAVFIGVWVAAVFTTVANYYYAGTQLICHTFHIRKKLYVVFGLLPFLYVIAMYPRNLFDLFADIQKITWLGGVVGVVIPPILLVVTLFRNRGKTNEKSSQSSTH